MKKRLGTYLTQTNSLKPYKAYIPQPLPPEPALDMARLYPLLEKATTAVAELNSVAKSVPNSSLFIYMYVRKEALLSSQIEGTQSSFADLMLFENQQKPSVSLDDVEEVSNYVKAIQYGIQRIQTGFPLSLRLLREIHKLLLSGARGSHKTPGEFRQSQNWIGGIRPENALFVPPPVQEMNKCLSDFEHFLHDPALPVLIKTGLAHVQFETIHPFLDGNGRLGRLLIILMLVDSKMITEPILYVSLYLKQHRKTYYDLLQEIRTNGSWETWLEIFLEAVIHSAQQALKTTGAITKLFAQDFAKIETLGRAQYSCMQVFEYLKKLPQVSTALIVKEVGISAPTARAALTHLVNLGIIEEITGNERQKVYVYKKYLMLLEEDAQPLR